MSSLRPARSTPVTALAHPCPSHAGRAASAAARLLLVAAVAVAALMPLPASAAPLPAALLPAAPLPAAPLPAAPLPAAPLPAAPGGGGPSPVSADGADLLSVSVEPDRMAVRFRAGAGSAVVEPARIRLGPGGGLAARVPDDPAFAFLGEPGTPVWSVAPGGPRFPAFDATGVERGTVRDNAVTIRLSSVDGPGEFAAYTLSAWGRPTVVLDSRAKDRTRLAAGTRLDGLAWTFDTPGDYRLTFRASAATADGPVAGTAQYLVQVPQLNQAAPAAAAAPQPEVKAAPRTAATAGQEGAAQERAAEEGAGQEGTGRPAAGQTSAAQRKVISDGHVDMGPQLTGGAWTIRLKDDATTPPTWRELGDVVLKVTDKAKIDVPAGAGYAFLGTAGDPIWLLPQTQQAGVVWPGWNTQHESVVGGTRGNVTWRLKGVTGPGEFKLFRTGSFGAPEVLFDSAKAMPQQLSIAPNTHAHGNWAFTKAGIYRLAVEMTGTTTAGKAVTDTKTLVFAVGDATDANAGFGAGSAAGGKDSGGDKTGGGIAGALAKTGGNLFVVGGIGVLLLGAGGIALIATRRRKPAAQASVHDGPM